MVLAEKGSWKGRSKRSILVVSQLENPFIPFHNRVTSSSVSLTIDRMQAKRLRFRSKLSLCSLILSLQSSNLILHKDLCFRRCEVDRCGADVIGDALISYFGK